MTAQVMPEQGGGTIDGLVWHDLNGDLDVNAGEPPLSGATIRLATLAGQPLGSQTTTADGRFRFANLNNGNYRLQATAPWGYNFLSTEEYLLTIMEGVTQTVYFPAAARLASCGGRYEGNTAEASARVSQYACQPWWDESGPEDIYILLSPITQTITATLYYNAAQADLDIFIVQEGDPAQCLAAGDYLAVSEETPAGPIYLVVDGFEGDAGLYTLEVECPAGPHATATPTPTPTATSTPMPTWTPTATATSLPSPTPTATAVTYRAFLPTGLRWHPLPTATPTPTITPTPTVTPTPTATPTPTPGIGKGRIEGWVFVDNNGNGLREPWLGEREGVAGVRLTLASGSTSLAAYVTDGSGWYGFLELDAGIYTVTRGSAQGYVSTTATERTVQIWPGQRSIDNNFGLLPSP